MDIQQEVRAAERALAAAGYSVRKFCFKAKIAPITWRAWRGGKGWPQMAKWRQAMAALEQIQNEAKRAKARKYAARTARKKRTVQPEP